MTHDQVYAYLVNRHRCSWQRANALMSWARDTADIAPIDSYAGVTYDHGTDEYEVVTDEESRQQISAIFDARRKRAL